MIVNYRHKGLELYASKGDRSKLHQQHVQKIKTILTRLDAATRVQEMDQPGYKFHSLSGDLQGFYSVKVSGNYRIIFRFEGENAYDVDYIDYH
jgi:proteic killer suppression protein